MRVLVSSIVLLFVFSSVRSKRWNTNKDSIVVEAEFDTSYDEPIVADGGVECLTGDNEAGICVQLKQCHPILFADGQVRNLELVETYLDLQKESNCTENEVEDSQNVTGERRICCARDKIQLAQNRADLPEYETTTGADAQLLEAAIDEDLVTTTGRVQDVGSGEVDIDIPTTTIKSQVVDEEIVDIVAVEQQPVEEISVTTTIKSVEEESIPVAEPQPIKVSDIEVPAEALVEDVPTQTPIVSTCPTETEYNTWPVFESYPWLASIQTRSNTGPLCSGALIDSHHVLTASHCLYRFNSRDVARIQVRLGFSKDPANDTLDHYHMERRVTRLILHKRFHLASKMDNNIALLRLDSPIEFTEQVHPINIFDKVVGYDAGSCMASVAGWIKPGNRKVTEVGDGMIKFIEAPMRDFHLREALATVLSNDECSQQLSSHITNDMICAKTTTNEVGKEIYSKKFAGNDGGPLVIKVNDGVQAIGIKSWVYEGTDYPTVYTRVSSYLEWISDNINL